MLGFESPSIGFESVKASHQNWSSSSKNEESNLNPLKEDSNLIFKEFRLRKVIRIPQRKIRILDSRMCKLKSLRTMIRIFMEMIQILILVRVAQTVGFKFSSKRFEFQMKKEVKLKATNSNP